MAAPDRWRVLVAIETLAWRDIARPALAPGVSAAPVDDQAARAAAPQGAPEVAADVRVFARAEHDPLYAGWPHAQRRVSVGPGSACWHGDECHQDQTDRN